MFYYFSYYLPNCPLSTNLPNITTRLHIFHSPANLPLQTFLLLYYPANTYHTVLYLLPSPILILLPVAFLTTTPLLTGADEQTC